MIPTKLPIALQPNQALNISSAAKDKEDVNAETKRTSSSSTTNKNQEHDSKEKGSALGSGQVRNSSETSKGKELLAKLPLPSIDTPHTGVSIKEVNFQTHNEELALVKKFIDETYQNSDYESIDHLVLRATNFFNNIAAERTINANARSSITDPHSDIAKQSAYMVHLMRGLWSKAQIDPEVREQLAQELIDRKDGKIVSYKLFNWIFEEAKNLHAMLVKGEEGPLTFEDSQLGVEAVFATKEMAKRVTINSEILQQLTKSVDANLIKANRGKTNHFQSPHGANLSLDTGTQIRDELGLPVMLGTSSVSSNVTATTKFVADNLGKSMWASGLSEEAAKDALIDAIFHFMREQVVPKTTKSTYDKMRQGLGAEPKEVDPFLMFTHSYPEVRAGAELTLDGEQKSEEAMRRSSELAKRKLDSFDGTD